MKRIAMFGICGKMGTSMTKELLKEKDIEVICGFDKLNVEKDMGYVLGIGENDKKIFNRPLKCPVLRPIKIRGILSPIDYETEGNWSL